MTHKHALIREWFTYDSRTGLVRWKKTASNRAVAGSVAGTRVGRYIHVTLSGKAFAAHQIAFVLRVGYIPHRIDHRDWDGTNNRWTNLRASTPSLNRANAGADKDNLTGFKGVTPRPGGKFRARIRVNYRLISLGDHATPQAAHAAYMRAARTHFGEFAHG